MSIFGDRKLIQYQKEGYWWRSNWGIYLKGWKEKNFVNLKMELEIVHTHNMWGMRMVWLYSVFSKSRRFGAKESKLQIWRIGWEWDYDGWFLCTFLGRVCFSLWNSGKVMADDLTRLGKTRIKRAFPLLREHSLDEMHFSSLGWNSK